MEDGMVEVFNSKPLRSLYIDMSMGLSDLNLF